MANTERKTEAPVKIEAEKLLDKMVALTLSRHATTAIEDFLKELNLDGDDEDQAVREARFKLYIAWTKETIKQIDSIKRLNAILKDFLGVTDEMLKGE